ncbi:helix-turn-helix domain-containing protein [Mycobacterium colombiense]|uniref:helix-turn-helix domain-containing protein n=1 Tax=Mycobacterium colombiense TaxID=339268 RepID=UPI0007EC5660|nr:helix-turn-helix transcriptional regulator [Mycobacterium colombiense]OBJ26873.1 hypothetical protein A5620_05480 [Mycobacterium colombiense]
MPSIDPEAKAFQMDLAARFGSTVSARRKALKLTASEVSRRTADLGYPISRGAIAQIESNSRSGKVDVAELLILSLALDIPPVLLLFGQFPSPEPVEVRPGVLAFVEDAVRWVSGRLSSPRKVVQGTFEGVGRVFRTASEDLFMPANDGVNLITAQTSLDKALEDRVRLMIRLEDVKNDGGDVDGAELMLRLHDEHIEALKKQILDAQHALWGLSVGTEEV